MTGNGNRTTYKKWWVMTGGWFIIVLPTLHYFQRIFIDIYWGSHFRLQEVSPWMIEIPICSWRIFVFNTMKLETMVVWMGWIMLIFPSVWLNIRVEHVFQYMLLSNRLIVVRAALFGPFYRITEPSRFLWRWKPEVAFSENPSEALPCSAGVPMSS